MRKREKIGKNIDNMVKWCIFHTNDTDNKLYSCAFLCSIQFTRNLSSIKDGDGERAGEKSIFVNVALKLGRLPSKYAIKSLFHSNNTQSFPIHSNYSSRQLS